MKNNTTKKDYEMFKKECKKWIKTLELSHWNIVYEHKELGNADAQSTIQLGDYTALIGLSTDISQEGIDLDMSFDEYIKECAKHEVVHVLTGRLSENARSRFVSSGDLYESVEELVTKLTKLL